MELTIKPLDSSLIDRYLIFFDRVAFTDNHDWAGCYCVFYHHRGRREDWEGRSADDNRAEAVRLIQDGILRGYLAFAGEEVVGWCNVNRKSAYGTFLDHPDLHAPDDDRTAALVCFVIAPAYRRQGVARRLLERVLDDLGKNGELDYLEAYPRRTAETDAANYHGPLAMYIKAGFSVVRGTEDSLVVRKALRQVARVSSDRREI